MSSLRVVDRDLAVVPLLSKHHINSLLLGPSFLCELASRCRCLVYRL